MVKVGGRGGCLPLVTNLEWGAHPIGVRPMAHSLSSHRMATKEPYQGAPPGESNQRRRRATKGLGGGFTRHTTVGCPLTPSYGR